MLAMYEIGERLRTLRGLVLDADGVFFDGKETRHTAVTGLLFDPWDKPYARRGSVISKTRDFRDGQGLSFLRAMGIRVLFASGENDPLKDIVHKLNELPSCVSGDWAPVEMFTDMKQGKGLAVLTWMDKHKLKWAETAYIGDDRTDCEAMYDAKCGGGLVVVPSDHQRVVRKYAGLVLTKPGGAGAIREFAELVCDARDIDEEGLAIA